MKQTNKSMLRSKVKKKIRKGKIIPCEIFTDPFIGKGYINKNGRFVKTL